MTNWPTSNATKVRSTRRNSRTDPDMLEAAERMVRLLADAADATEDALVEYDLAPRWCGVPDVPPSPTGPVSRSEYSYPYDHILIREQGDEDTLPYPNDWVKDEKSGFRYHRTVMRRLAERLRLSLPPVEYEIRRTGGGESPRRFIDRVRAVLRWEHRLDSPSLVTSTLALLKCVRKGRPRCVSHASTGIATFHQEYEYVPLPRADIEVLPAAVALSDRILDAFRHADMALMPRDPNDVELEFLSWLRDRGGLCRLSEVILWVDADERRGHSNRGQGIERSYLRDFCEKDAPRGARAPWRIRDAALELLRQKEAR